MTEKPRMNGASLHNIQHSAFRCRDAEQTRWFYEEVLGLKLAAVLRVGPDDSRADSEPCLHIFFELGDGNHIAFFDEPLHARPEHFDKKHGYDLHIAFEVHDSDALKYWKQRWKEADIAYSTIDHGFLHSIYCYDPNGIRVEITCKTPQYPAYMQEQSATARQTLDRWTQATRKLKIERLGAAQIDNRTHLSADLPPLT